MIQKIIYFILTLFLVSLHIFAQEPKRIVTLVPSLGELVADFLRDDLSKIVGVSEYTDYPPKLKLKESIGPYYKFNIEKVVSLKPDLIFATQDGNAKDQILHLRELGLQVVVVNTTSLSEVYQSIDTVGNALGKKEMSSQMIAQLKRGIENIRVRNKKHAVKKVLLQIGYQPLVVAGKRTFLNDILDVLNVQNVYSESRMSYPRPSFEDVIQKNPDVIIIFAMDKNLKSFYHFYRWKREWLQFKQINAVRQNQIHVILGDTLLRPTLRLLEGLSMLEKTLGTVFQ
ncbi:MAG: ABC transporter substrate-binding protein [Deltaproteobacteria bacterium]|nr:ABC transporter substrate-binding protein [Deltaproteobacteria bacterium]